MRTTSFNMHPMNRFLRLTALALTLLCFVATTALAQSPEQDATTSAAVKPAAQASVDQQPTQSLVVQRQAAPSITSREDVVRAMRFAPDLPQAQHAAAEMKAIATDAPSSPMQAMQEDGNRGRRILYITAGVLVAGGLAVGILLLSNEDGGIPPPPSRP